MVSFLILDMEIQFFYLLIFILIVLQSIIGVGILVLGTPLLLILNYEFIEIMALLLPISILTSLFNYLYLKYHKKNLKINLDRNIKKNFIILFIPGIVIGLILTREFQNFINFKLLVSFVIILSLITKWKLKDVINASPLFFKRFVLMLVGIIHGLTNSGGTLLTVFFTSLNNSKKDQSRYSITFYYLILVFIQYLVFLIVFDKTIFQSFFLQIILMIITASLMGNMVSKKISEKFFHRTIEILALISAIFLITTI